MALGSSLFVAPVLMMFLCIIFMASLGKSFGVRRFYVKLLLKVFEVSVGCIYMVGRILGRDNLIWDVVAIAWSCRQIVERRVVHHLTTYYQSTYLSSLGRNAPAIIYRQYIYVSIAHAHDPCECSDECVGKQRSYDRSLFGNPNRRWCVSVFSNTSRRVRTFRHHVHLWCFIADTQVREINEMLRWLWLWGNYIISGERSRCCTCVVDKQWVLGDCGQLPLCRRMTWFNLYLSVI